MPAARIDGKPSTADQGPSPVRGTHRPTDTDRPRRVAFVDGTLRTEARRTRTGPDGDVSIGLAGSWAGAGLVDGHEPARFDRLTTEDALYGYGCYLRGGRLWAGIARLEIPSGIGRDAAVEAAGWVPDFASALHRDARGPVNLTQITGLERHRLRERTPRLALRVVREAVPRTQPHTDGRH